MKAKVSRCNKINQKNSSNSRNRAVQINHETISKSSIIYLKRYFRHHHLKLYELSNKNSSVKQNTGLYKRTCWITSEIKFYFNSKWLSSSRTYLCFSSRKLNSSKRSVKCNTIRTQSSEPKLNSTTFSKTCSLEPMPLRKSEMAWNMDSRSGTVRSMNSCRVHQVSL